MLILKKNHLKKKKKDFQNDKNKNNTCYYLKLDVLGSSSNKHDHLEMGLYISICNPQRFKTNFSLTDTIQYQLLQIKPQYVR